MKRTFKTVDYAQALDLTVRLGDCLPPDHLARFVVDSVAQLDLSALYGRYGTRGGEPYAPEVLLGLLLYGYATGVFSSRKIERATYEAVPFRFIAGNLHPDHDTLATFRRTFLPELKDLFVQVLLLAKAGGRTETGDHQPGWNQGACRCPPLAKRSATNGCARWRPSCELRSRNCLP